MYVTLRVVLFVVANTWKKNPVLIIVWSGMSDAQENAPDLRHDIASPSLLGTKNNHTVQSTYFALFSLL